MAPKKAFEIASQWGSYIYNGDPGSVFYTFPVNDARVIDETHRSLLLAYTDNCIAGASSPQDVAEMRDLRNYFTVAVCRPESKRRHA